MSMTTEQARFATFRRWPHPSSYTPSPVKLSKSGFFHSPTPTYPDRTLCFCCGLALVHWNKNHDPWSEHVKRMPTCGLVTGAYTKFRYEEARMRSFDRWPVPATHLATPAKLVASGFFMCPTAQFADRCVCFCCGIALVRWEKGDDPWTEHQQHSKTCPFVRGNDVGNVPAAVPPEEKNNGTLERLVTQLEECNIDAGAEAPSHFLCPITQDLFVDPVVAEDGHTYDREGIKKWLSSHNTSPLTNKMLYSKRIIPNHNLHAQLIEYLESLLDASKKPKAIEAAAQVPSPAQSAQEQSRLLALQAAAAVTVPSLSSNAGGQPVATVPSLSANAGGVST